MEVNKDSLTISIIAMEKFLDLINKSIDLGKDIYELREIQKDLIQELKEINLKYSY